MTTACICDTSGDDTDDEGRRRERIGRCGIVAMRSLSIFNQCSSVTSIGWLATAGEGEDSIVCVCMFCCTFAVSKRSATNGRLSTRLS